VLVVLCCACFVSRGGVLCRAACAPGFMGCAAVVVVADSDAFCVSVGLLGSSLACGILLLLAECVSDGLCVGCGVVVVFVGSPVWCCLLLVGVFVCGWVAGWSVAWGLGLRVTWSFVVRLQLVVCGWDGVVLVPRSGRRAVTAVVRGGLGVLWSLS